MPSTADYVGFVCEQIREGNVRYRKMFGEYMVYVNDKPLLLICDDTVYVKKLDALRGLMENAEVGYPYDGAREHYILDIENNELTNEVITVLEQYTAVPVKKSRAKKKKE